MKTRLFAILVLMLVTATFLLGRPHPSISHSASEPDEVLVSEKDDGSQVELPASDVLVVNLECNLSAGYRWDVQMIDAKILRRVGEFEFTQESELIGAPGTQTLRFVGEAKGLASLQLVYHHPWQEKAEALKTFSIQVQSEGAFEGQYELESAPPPPPEPEKGFSKTQLPAHFNWCEQDKCTPMKRQLCGDCWAFATIAVMESHIKIYYDDVDRDLSEQYLVSCNTHGWGCANGGWEAHDYHQWLVPPGEPGAGAVYESDFAYLGQDAPCNPPHPHYERIGNWDYVDNSVADIKQAIFDYGPVWTSMCVGNQFQDYDGGVFQTDESSACLPAMVNHAVTLVGWDDSAGVWYLKNSWGTDWGEDGYMRIKYGVSNIGYRTSYVEQGTGPDPTPTPTVTCQRVDGQSGYWYECDGVQVTQVAYQFWNDYIQNFQVIGDRAFWQYRNGQFGQYAYYYNYVSGGSI